MAEWSKALAWNAGRLYESRGFKSHFLRHFHKFVMLGGELAVPYNLQSATAGLKS